MIRAVVAGLIWLALATCCWSQGQQCRTAPNGTISSYCASEAFITQHFPSSATAGHSAVFADSTGQLLADGGSAPGGGVTSLGAATGALDAPVTVTSGRALTNADCENPLLLGNNTQFTMTVNAPSSYTCDRFRLTNNDTYSGASSGRGKLISATLVNGITAFWLMPGQSVDLIASGSSAWQTDKEVTGIGGVGYLPRWKTNVAWTGYVNSGASASDTTQDGLADGASGAGSFASIGHCLAVMYKLLDTQNNQPVCSPKTSQSFNENNVTVSGQPVGTNAFFISGNGGPFTWSASANCIQPSDGAEIIFQNVNLNCNTSNTAGIGHIFAHQAIIIDIFGGVTCTGNGGSDSCVVCDSNCRVNTTSGITLAGTFNDFLHSTGAHSNFAVGGAITASGLTISQIYTLSAPLGSIVTTATYSGTFGGSPRQFAVLNNSVLCDAGGSIPGSAGITSSAGYANGFHVTNCN